MKDCSKYGNCSICCCENIPAPFRGFNEKDFEILNAERKEVTFYPGEIIFKQGTAVTHFCCFRSGLAKVYFERPTGNNILINIINKGNLRGSMGFYTDNMHHMTYQALTEVSLCLLPVKNIETLLHKNNEMAIELIAGKQQSIIYLTNKLANLTYKSMVARVADVLLYLHKEIYQSLTFKINLTRQDLADLAAMTKESFIRSLKELKNSGIVNINRNDIVINDLSALKKISNG